MKFDTAKKSKYFGVYMKPEGEKPYFSYVRFLDSRIIVYSDTEVKAAINYNIISRFCQGDKAKQNPIKVSDAEYKKVAKELLYQLSEPTSAQIFNANQGYKKIVCASTKYVGVYKYPGRELYHASISKNGKRYSLGYFRTSVEGACAYNIAAPFLYGDNARLNDVDMSLIDQAFINKILNKMSFL